MSKYGNHKTKAAGLTFDSKRERDRWNALCLMERAGAIKNLQRQVKYPLIPIQREPDIIGPRGGTKPGKVIEHPCSYIADFVYERDGKTVVEDSKGHRTSDYIIKRKLMLWIHGIRILET